MGSCQHIFHKLMPTQIYLEIHEPYTLFFSPCFSELPVGADSIGCASKLPESTLGGFGTQLGLGGQCTQASAFGGYSYI